MRHPITSRLAFKLLNFIWVSTSYPDKSIWPNHITALAGTARTTPPLALAAGIAICEAAIFGGKPFKVAIDFFKTANSYVSDGGELADFVDAELKQHKVIFGYGRPLASTDERVPHLIKFVKENPNLLLTLFINFAKLYLSKNIEIKNNGTNNPSEKKNIKNPEYK